MNTSLRNAEQMCDACNLFLNSKKEFFNHTLTNEHIMFFADDEVDDDGVGAITITEADTINRDKKYR